MISKIAFITSVSFAVIYPLCFLVSFKDPLKNHFHRFHLGTPTVIGGVVLFFLLQSDTPFFLKSLFLLFELLLFTLTLLVYKKDFFNPLLIFIPGSIGLLCFIGLHKHFIAVGPEAAVSGLLAGFIFCSAFYAMNLGHWYLNVHGLPIKHLRAASYVFWVLLGIRFFWDLYILLTHNVFYRGDWIPVRSFVANVDGFLLLVPVFFGTLFPLGACFFVKETIDLKNTQSTTGILYVILCSVLIGDIAYKYFLIKYNIPM